MIIVSRLVVKTSGMIVGIEGGATLADGTVDEAPVKEDCALVEAVTVDAKFEDPTGAEINSTYLPVYMIG